jgi:hypothetical protein
MSVRQVNRLINISFKVSGVKEASDDAAELKKLLNTLLRSIITIQLLVSALEATSLSPRAIIRGGIAIGSAISLGQDLM